MPSNGLVKRFIHAGISLLIKDITQKDIGIPSFSASSIEWVTQDYGFFAKGFGTHPDARIALTRAITEVSQTRAVNIHGARDDLKKVKYTMNDEIYKRKWPFIPASSSQQGAFIHAKILSISSEIKTHFNEDILMTYILLL